MATLEEQRAAIARRAAAAGMTVSEYQNSLASGIRDEQPAYNPNSGTGSGREIGSEVTIPGFGKGTVLDNSSDVNLYYGYKPLGSYSRDPASLDFALNNGIDAYRDFNRAMYLGYTPEMYAYAAKAFQDYPVGYQTGMNSQDGAAINWYSSGTPKQWAEKMMADGVPVGSTPKFEEYRQKMPGMDFLEGYQPTKEAVVPEGLYDTFPDYQFGAAAENPTYSQPDKNTDGEWRSGFGPSPPAGYVPPPSTPYQGAPIGGGTGGGGGSQPGGGWNWDAFNPGGGGGGAPAPEIPMGEYTGPDFNPQSRLNDFYTKQFGKLVGQQDQFNAQKAQADAMRAEASANPPAPDLSWDWLEGGLPEVETSTGQIWEMNDSLRNTPGNTTNQQILNQLSGSLNPETVSFFEEVWGNNPAGGASTNWSETVDPIDWGNTFQSQAGPRGQRAREDLAGALFQNQGESFIPQGYAAPVAGMGNQVGGYQRGTAQYQYDPTQGAWAAFNQI